MAYDGTRKGIRDALVGVAYSQQKQRHYRTNGQRENNKRCLRLRGNRLRKNICTVEKTTAANTRFAHRKKIWTPTSTISATR